MDRVPKPPFSIPGTIGKRRRNAARIVGLCLAITAVLVWKQWGKTLQAQAPSAATLISPDGTAVNLGKPFFLWKVVSAATEYRLKVANGSATVVDDVWNLATSVCSGSFCGATAPTSLPNGSYTWWVQTRNADGEGPLSPPMLFGVDAYGFVDGGFTHSVVGNRYGAASSFGLNTNGHWG